VGGKGEEQGRGTEGGGRQRLGDRVRHMTGILHTILLPPLPPFLLPFPLPFFLPSLFLVAMLSGLPVVVGGDG
jgi:hypothetical protein